MKRLIALHLLVFSSLASAQQEETSMEKFCNQADKIASIASPYMNFPNLWPAVVATPVGPVPSFTFFFNENRNPMTDFCSFVNKLKYMKQSGSWYAAANLANEMSANQFKEEIGMVLDIKDISEAVGNAQKKGNMSQNVALHRRISRLTQSSYMVGMKHKLFSGETGSNGEPSIEQRNQRAAKMNNYARAANRVSVLNETINCKNPTVSRSEGAEEFYKENIQPIEYMIDEQNDEAEYALYQLRKIGVMMSGRYEENQKYQKALLELKTSGITIMRSDPKTKKFDVTRKGELERIELPYFTYSIKLNTNKFTEFEKEYVSNWKTIALANTQTKGLFAKENNFIKEMRDLTYECRYSKMEWDVRKSNEPLRTEPSDSGILRQEVLKKVAACKETFKFSQNGADNLFSNYVLMLKNALQSKLSIEMMMWNYESEYLGINRSVTMGLATTDLGDIAQRKVSCDNPLSEADAKQLQSDLQATTTELKGQIVEEFIEKTMHYEQLAKEKEEARKKKEREEKINEEIQRRKTWIDDDMKPTNFDNLKF